ncbi:hypothetical protein LXL04_033165 [Taraxacum kok-saghyz]
MLKTLSQKEVDLRTLCPVQIGDGHVEGSVSAYGSIPKGFCFGSFPTLPEIKKSRQILGSKQTLPTKEQQMEEILTQKPMIDYSYLNMSIL